MMSAKLSSYSFWIDPNFYLWAALFGVALVSLIYSIRRYLELKNASEEDEEVPTGGDMPSADAGQAAEEQERAIAAAPSFQPDFSEVPREEGEPAGETAQEASSEPEAGPVPAPSGAAAPVEAAVGPGTGPHDFNRAENFVRGIYAGISDLDERMKNIEASLSKSRVNGDFTVKFLEDVLQDLDSLDKAKIRARIEYLISDLKK